jgi:2-(1,2-epoxy-1,2-dihydrophenyl)acetyl-CoA isomerase
MSYETIEVSAEDGITTITLNRPEKLNAWTYQMSDEMVTVIEQGNADNDTEAFIVTGAGRGFCAGADISEVFKTQADGGEVRRGSRDPSNWVRLMRESKPIVAAVNGAAIGVGLTQVLPMDYIVASTDARLSCRFIRMGLVPELASSHYLVERCGFGAASELMLSGKTVSAEEAQRIRLVDKVTAPDELLSEAKAVAKSMGENPQAALSMVKRLISDNMSESDTDLVQRREMEALLKCYASEEHKEAIAAFLEKRDPDFRAARNR